MRRAKPEVRLVVMSGGESVTQHVGQWTNWHVMSRDVICVCVGRGVGGNGSSGTGPCGWACRP